MTTNIYDYRMVCNYYASEEFGCENITTYIVHILLVHLIHLDDWQGM